MKTTTIIASFLILTSCASLTENRIAPGYSEAFSAINNLLFGYENNISNKTIQEIPFASSLIQIGNGPIGLMILEKKVNNIESWVTADGINIFVENGRIIRTFGLENNLTMLKYPKHKKIHLNSLPSTSYYSYDEPFLQDLKVEIITNIKKSEYLKVLDEEIEVILIEEKLSSKKIRWNVVNKYWVDSEGFTWKSEQSISPKLPKFLITVTKKPSN